MIGATFRFTQAGSEVGALLGRMPRAVCVPGVDASMGFLNNHAPLITVLKAGEVNGGVVEVSNNTVLVLAE